MVSLRQHQVREAATLAECHSCVVCDKSALRGGTGVSDQQSRTELSACASYCDGDQRFVVDSNRHRHLPRLEVLLFCGQSTQWRCCGATIAQLQRLSPAALCLGATPSVTDSSECMTTA